MEKWCSVLRRGIAHLCIPTDSGLLFQITEVLLGEEPTPPAAPVTVFVNTGDVTLVLGTVSAERPVLAVTTPLVLNNAFMLLHDSTDVSIHVHGHMTAAPAPQDERVAAAQMERDMRAFLNELLDELFECSNDDEDMPTKPHAEATGESNSSQLALPAWQTLQYFKPGGPFLGPARFACIEDTAGYMRVAAAETIGTAGSQEGKEISVCYRYTYFDLAEDEQGVEYRTTRFHHVQFLLPEAGGDFSGSLPWVSSSLIPSVYPKERKQQLDALWSDMIEGCTFPENASCIQLIADVGILLAKDYSPAAMELVRGALEAKFKKAWPGYHKDVEVRLPAMVQCREDGETDGERPSQRRRIAEGEACSICLDELEGSGSVARMECSHFFHADCLGQWIKESFECPNCRHNMASEH